MAFRYEDNDAMGCLVILAASTVVGLIVAAVCGGVWLYFYIALSRA